MLFPINVIKQKVQNTALKLLGLEILLALPGECVFLWTYLAFGGNFIFTFLKICALDWENIQDTIPCFPYIPSSVLCKNV